MHTLSTRTMHNQNINISEADENQQRNQKVSGGENAKTHQVEHRAQNNSSKHVSASKARTQNNQLSTPNLHAKA